jgi:hypothetical protein
MQNNPDSHDDQDPTVEAIILLAINRRNVSLAERVASIAKQYGFRMSRAEELMRRAGIDTCDEEITKIMTGAYIAPR